MPETPLNTTTTLAFGAAGTYAERASNANSYAPIEGRRIYQVEIATSPDRVIRADELLIQHPLAIQELARAYLDTLVIVAFPEMIEDMTIEEHFPDGRVGTRENPQFFPDLLESATGDHLARAIHAKFHGFGVGEREHLTFAGNLTDGPGIIDCNKVRVALIAAGIQAVRYVDSTSDRHREEGHFWQVLDPQIVTRAAVAHFSLDFTDYPTPEAREAADLLNHDWLLLDGAARAAVQQAVGVCRREGGRVALPFRDGEVVAYQNAGGSGFSWDLDDGQGSLARGLQRLPADATPAIRDPGELRIIGASWEQLGDVAAAAKDPARARDLLAAAAWHLKAIERWAAPFDNELRVLGLSDQTVRSKDASDPIPDLKASVLAGVDRRQASGAMSAEHAQSLRFWIDGEDVQKLTSAEDRAAHDTVRARYDQLCEAVAANSADPAWLKAFDVSGWPNVEQRTVATSLREFIGQLFDIHAAHQSRPADDSQEPGQTQSKGRGR
jgi:hypothetical protein